MIFQILAPLESFALTSGPSQPEMQSFEPVGTTNLVDPFTGDFTYNVPLMDIEGYPINIAYNSGISVEQEASWVGLGWNLNPGNVSHLVRGIPDDFNGDVIEKEVIINDEKSMRINGSVNSEMVGTDVPQKKWTPPTFTMNFNNYTGVSAGLSGFSVNPVKKSLPFAKSLSAGVNLGFGVSTDKGADFDYNLSLSKSSGLGKTLSGAVNGNFGQQFNSSQGLLNTSFGVNASIRQTAKVYKRKSDKIVKGQSNLGLSGVNFSSTPISLANYVPVITNASLSRSRYFQLRVGVEGKGKYTNGIAGLGEDVTSVTKNGSKRSYGFFNLQNASTDDILDFSRDRDGRFHPKMNNLPPSNMTYDLYNVSGQGTSGSFRAFRNDLGSVYDPVTGSEGASRSFSGDAGFGDMFEAGLDKVKTITNNSSGPFKGALKPYSKKQKNSLHEPYYIKQAGELSVTNDKLMDVFGGSKYEPMNYEEMNALEYYPSGSDYRPARANSLYFFTAMEAEHAGVSLNPKIESYKQNGYPSPKDLINRTDANRPKHLISEVVQVLPNGERYTYGIPAMNLEQREYVLSEKASSLYSSPLTGEIGLTDSDPSVGQTTSEEIGQNFFMKTTTPKHAHSYLLTNILSSDYVDMTGDGITDDDLGTYTKFNYSLKTNQYIWRAPYDVGMARHNPGVRSDCHDDRAAFTAGKKEVWHLHSIETKNYVAEFHTSPRVDGAGAEDILSMGGVDKAPSYKLDRIKLYNKRDKIENGTNAKLIKEVLFTYDYSLCKGIPNQLSSSPNANVGKLTLKAISIRHGASDIGLLSPYRFDYSTENPAFDSKSKDVWGNYKHLNSNANTEPGAAGDNLNMTNFEFPYVNQNDQDLDKYAAAWNLTKIHLPSGGTIDVEYESDDYAYVQDKKAMQMFKVEGVGSSQTFKNNNVLYQDKNNPFLYIYFRKADGTSIEDYDLATQTDIQYNFEVILNKGESTPSCDIPLVDNIKGYADIEEFGDCSGSSQHSYIKIRPRRKMQTGGLLQTLSGDNIDLMKLNPITLAAINYGRYYNNKSLNPGSELIGASPDKILKAFWKAFGNFRDYARSPYIKFLNKGIAKEFNIGRSFIRLNSDGFKKGGGHRVSQVTFSDSWDEIVDGGKAATYGSTYEYVTEDENGDEISSGVASYEPLLGGDENPWKQQMKSDRVGNDSRFPMVDPIELINEAPIGEAFFPSASVGYSKVKISNIHKDKGKSAQVVEQHEFYTAKDFPVKVKETPIDLVHDYPKKISMLHDKSELLSVSQGYSIFLNDMHGKPKMQSTLLNNSEVPIAFKKYEYYTSAKNSNELDNKVNVLSVVKNGAPTSVQNGRYKKEEKELGVEMDFTLDSREKIDKTTTTGFNLNLNVFSIGLVPVPIPLGLPKIKKSYTKTFNSVVGTKIIQKYGIIKSVETFDKGATVRLSNDCFDGVTGEPLVTQVNTEHEDKEYSMKMPAFSAYPGMGPAYENVKYVEEVDNNCTVNDGTVYLNTENLDRFNVGDEVIFDINKSCMINSGEELTVPQTYKMWVVDKGEEMDVPDVYSDPGIATCLGLDDNCTTTNPFVYDLRTRCGKNPYPSSYFGFPNTNDKPEYDNSSSTQHWNSSNGEINNWLNHHSVCNIPYSDLFSVNSAKSRYFVNQRNYPLAKKSENFRGTKNTPITRFFEELIAVPNTGHTELNRFKTNVLGNDFTKPLLPVKAVQIFNSSPEYIANSYHPNNVHYKLDVQEEGITDDPTSKIIHIPGRDDFHMTTGNRSHCYHPGHDGQSFPLRERLFLGKINPNNNSSYNGLGQHVNVNTYNRYVAIKITVATKSDLNIYYNNPTTQVSNLEKTIEVQDPTKPRSLRNNNYTSGAHYFYIPVNKVGGKSTLFKNLNGTGAANQKVVTNWTTLSALPDYEPFHLTKVGNCTWSQPASVPSYLQPRSYYYGTDYSYDFNSELMYKIEVDEIDATELPVIPQEKKSIVVLKPHKKDMNSFTDYFGANRWNGDPLPAVDFIKDGSVKIIRSGKRNNLGASIHEMSSLNDPINTTHSIATHNKVLSIGATTYSNEQEMKGQIIPGNWHNDFVTGLVSSYRPLSSWMLHKNRLYSGPHNDLDKNKGYMNSVRSPWKLALEYNKPAFIQNTVVTSSTKWYQKSKVLRFDVWGNDSDVEDASGANHCNLYGYAHDKPIAVVSNARSDQSLFENFEDYNNPLLSVYLNSPTSSPVAYFQNQFRQAVWTNLQSVGGNYILSDDAHSGNRALEVGAAPMSINVAVENQTLTNDEIESSFFLNENTSYLVSYWQKVDQNVLPQVYGDLDVVYDNNMIGKFKKCTPVIDGWVQYSGVLSMPAQTASTALFNLKQNSTFDDLRILPLEANMKSYVYDDENQRLMAVLDENNMATFFEYSNEGKLQRVKKETEKGVLSLKESRESLKNILNPPIGTGPSNLGGTTSTLTPTIQTAPGNTILPLTQPYTYPNNSNSNY